MTSPLVAVSTPFGGKCDKPTGGSVKPVWWRMYDKPTGGSVKPVWWHTPCRLLVVSSLFGGVRVKSPLVAVSSPFGGGSCPFGPRIG